MDTTLASVTFTHSQRFKYVRSGQCAATANAQAEPTPLCEEDVGGDQCEFSVSSVRIQCERVSGFSVNSFSVNVSNVM